MASLGHGRLGVESEVEQHVLDLMRVDEGRPKPGAEHRLDVDILAEGAVEDLDHVGHEAVEVDPRRLQRLPPRESKQALRELRGAIGALESRLHRFRQLAAQLGHGARIGSIDEGAPHGVEIANDDGEKIVEVMRDAAREQADRLHLLRLAKRLLGLLAQLRFGLKLGRAFEEALHGGPRGDRQDACQNRGCQQSQADQPRKHITRLRGMCLA
jgi:hypothetical protein